MSYVETVKQFAKTLRNLSAILDKGSQYAQTKNFQFSVLLNSRLAPDQFDLSKQIQIACDTAKLSAARLAGKDAPVHEDNETSLEQFKTRINSVVDYLESFTAADFTDTDERKVTQPRWKEKYLSGVEYVNEYAVPNFYFHITTAYSILRHNGVDIGKNDYLGRLSFKK